MRHLPSDILSNSSCAAFHRHFSDPLVPHRLGINQAQGCSNVFSIAACIGTLRKNSFVRTSVNETHANNTVYAPCAILHTNSYRRARRKFLCFPVSNYSAVLTEATAKSLTQVRPCEHTRFLASPCTLNETQKIARLYVSDGVAHGAYTHVVGYV